MAKGMLLFQQAKPYARRATAILSLVFVTVFYLLGTISPRIQYFHYVGDERNISFVDDTEDGFLVRSRVCHIPDVEPRHESIVKYLKPAEPIICSRLPPLTYTVAEDGRQVLRVDVGIVPQYVPSLQRLTCCYSVITRINEHDNNISKCVNFNKKAVLDLALEFLLVQCFDKKNKRKPVYSNMHAVVQLKRNKSTISKEDKSSAPVPTSSDNNVIENIPPEIISQKPNVLLLGIDSISRLNLIRTMPRTVAYLQANKWLEFRGYNKVGDNTLPNLMAILSGLNREQLTHIKCWPGKDVNIDNCPFIWSDFKQRGYVTAYAEDEFQLSTFNYKAHGFDRQPTDYYFRPFMVTARQKLPYQTRDGHTICLGPTPTTEHFLKLSMDLVTTVKNALFALIWLNNFSHNNHNTPAALDDRIHQFMQELSSTDALNNTIIVFLSDHGARFGKIRETFVGWLEERLPFLYMRVPDWFQEKYPEAYQNLQDNGNKLTSPYDVHLTLKDILDGSIGKASNGSEGCPTCESLFTPVKTDRRCEDAGISSHWCTCATQTPTSTSASTVLNATEFAVSEITTMLAKANNDTKCAVLKLNSVLNARVKDVNSKKSKTYKDYVVVFDTLPGLALFDATVRYWPKAKEPDAMYKVIGLISRINSYATNSNCTDDKDLKLYCHCLNS